jgi:hypothetical protein
MTALKRLVPLAILLGTVTAIAQPDPTAPAAPAGTAAATPTPTITLSASEMKERSAVIITEIQSEYQRVVGLRERVRKMKDVIKLDCVNDRLVQMKAQMNIADHANTSFQAIVDRDVAQGRDLFGQLENARAAVKDLHEQAKQCVGEPDLYKQEAGIEVTRPDLVDDPGAQDPYLPDGTTVEPPGYASAFM